MINQEQLAAYAAELEIPLSEAQLAAFDRYAEILVDWNGRMNLTTITKPEEIVVKHFVDSLRVLHEAEIPQGASLIDVGAGAGFPSVPLKIVRPDLRLTLLDSLNKRVTFLDALSEALAQGNVCLHGRAEEAGRSPTLRAQFDFATARGVAHLRELSEYCLPFVKLGGVFAALKGGEIDAELKDSQRAIALLCGRVESVKRFTLPDGSSRTIVLIRKVSHTTTKYPRPHAKMLKNPLI